MRLHDNLSIITFYCILNLQVQSIKCSSFLARDTICPKIDIGVALPPTKDNNFAINA
jgi:hypothetical protein